MTCDIGACPSHVVNVSTVAHIQLAINLARNANIRVVIKNTGHDFLGKSVGAGALSIWTHHLKNVEFLPNYKSDSGYEGSVFKVAAGVTVRELYQAADKHNVIVTGGICESVGFAGGYIAGGEKADMYLVDEAWLANVQDRWAYANERILWHGNRQHRSAQRRDSSRSLHHSLEHFIS